METFYSELGSADWKKQSDKNGLSIFHKPNSAKNTMLKCQKVMDFCPQTLFMCIVDGDYRQKYDPDIEIAKFTQKLARNIYTIYQRSFKILTVGPRDFESVCFVKKVSIIVVTYSFRTKRAI
jgi:hypothetical protein